MEGYAAESAPKMPRCFGWRSDKERRRYAAIAAAQRGQGGVADSAPVLGGDPPTMRQGLRELEAAEDAAAGRSRQKGGDACRAPSPRRPSTRLAVPCGRRAPLGRRGGQASWGRTWRAATGRDGCEGEARRRGAARSDAA
jgi:hypothetical protein